MIKPMEMLPEEDPKPEQTQERKEISVCHYRNYEVYTTQKLYELSGTLLVRDLSGKEIGEIYINPHESISDSGEAIRAEVDRLILKLEL